MPGDASCLEMRVRNLHSKQEDSLALSDTASGRQLLRQPDEIDAEKVLTACAEHSPGLVSTIQPNNTAMS
jgi:hypothetical protein